jgi:hypothetical protein
MTADCEQHSEWEQSAIFYVYIILHLEELGLPLKFLFHDSRQIVSHQVVEHHGVASRQAGADSRREKGAASALVYIRFQSPHYHLGGSASGVFAARIKRPPCIGGKDDEGVFERNVFVNIVVVQDPRIQKLQEQVYRVEVGFFDFVNLKKALGVFLDEARKRAGL